MPEEWGGMGLGHVELAMVQAPLHALDRAGRRTIAAYKDTGSTRTATGDLPV